MGYISNAFVTGTIVPFTKPSPESYSVRMKPFGDNFMWGGQTFVKMSQLLQTELCECGKLRQVRKPCKSCGSNPWVVVELPNEFYRPVARIMPTQEEDDIERARR
jgi:hypothetical protein